MLSRFVWIGPLDLLVFGLILTGVTLTWPWIWRANGHDVLIKVEGEDVARMRMSGKPHTIAIKGKIGVVVIEASESGIRILSAPCPNQICVRQGKIHRAGAHITCLPSRLSVAVQGLKSDQDLDGITY